MNDLFFFFFFFYFFSPPKKKNVFFFFFFFFKLTTRFIIVSRMSRESQSRREFSQFVTYHTICKINRLMFLSIMNSDCMANHFGYNGRCPRPSYYYFFLLPHVEFFNFSQ